MWEDASVKQLQRLETLTHCYYSGVKTHHLYHFISVFILAALYLLTKISSQAQSTYITKSATVYVHSSEPWLSPPPSPASECALPHGRTKGGPHSPAGEGVGESQFRRPASSLPTLCSQVSEQLRAEVHRLKAQIKQHLGEIYIQKYIILWNVNFTLYSTICVSDHGCTLEPAPFPGPDSTCWRTDLHQYQKSAEY